MMFQGKRHSEALACTHGGNQFMFEKDMHGARWNEIKLNHTHSIDTINSNNTS